MCYQNLYHKYLHYKQHKSEWFFFLLFVHNITGYAQELFLTLYSGTKSGQRYGDQLLDRGSNLGGLCVRQVPEPLSSFLSPEWKRRKRFLLKLIHSAYEETESRDPRPWWDAGWRSLRPSPAADGTSPGSEDHYSFVMSWRCENRRCKSKKERGQIQSAFLWIFLIWVSLFWEHNSQLTLLFSISQRTKAPLEGFVEIF